MQTTFTGGALAANLLGIVAALFVAALLLDIRRPLFGSDRATFIGLVVIGITMCALGGIGRSQSTLGWTDPVTLVGIVIGSLALLLVAAVLAGKAELLAPVAARVGGTTRLSWSAATAQPRTPTRQRSSRARRSQ